jgi:hypothetical protein
VVQVIGKGVCILISGETNVPIKTPRFHPYTTSESFKWRAGVYRDKDQKDQPARLALSSSSTLQVLSIN